MGSPRIWYAKASSSLYVSERTTLIPTDIPFTQLESTGKIAMAAKIMFSAAATFTRLSLFCFYYRLVHETTKRRFVMAIHANVAFSVAIFITFFFLSIFQCTPIQNYWTFGAPSDTCVDEGAATLAAGIINCVADLLCTLLPMHMVAKVLYLHPDSTSLELTFSQLQMPKRQRIAVVILFSLGFIVTVAGIVRTYYIYRSVVASYDQTWEAYPLWICAAVEIDLGVVSFGFSLLNAQDSFRLTTSRSAHQRRSSGPSSLRSRTSYLHFLETQLKCPIPIPRAH
jgi:hypothetical protein